MGDISLAALTSHPIQYQAPLFRAISDRPGIDLTVYFCSRQGYESQHDSGFGTDVEWDVPLVEGYDHVFLDSVTPMRSGDTPFKLNPGIVEPLARGEPDALWIHGYGSLTALIAHTASSWYGIPTILRGEGTPSETQGLSAKARAVFLNALFETVDAFAYIGSRNERFYREFGVERERLFHAPYTVHNEFFRSRRATLPEKPTLRDDIGIPRDRPTILFVGKLVERKRPELLLKAFSRATEPGEATLLFVGDGEKRDVLERRTEQLGREDDVVFTGFVNQSDLPRYYEAADVFTLPSVQENWGLVVNEAMNFELPVIATDAVGSTDDLVDEETGCVIPTDDGEALASTLADAAENVERWRQRGENAAERIADWGIEETADGIVAASQFVAE